MTSADRRAREREELQDKILDAARELFARHGYEAVTLRKIAEAIEYTPATIYGHFKDKDDLIRTLCKRDFDEFSAGMAQLAHVADPIERIRQLGHGYVQFALEHPQHYRLMFMSPADLEHDEDTLARKGDPHRDGYAFLRFCVQQAIEAGLLRDEYTDAELVAQTFWAGVHGVASLQITHSSDDWVDWRAVSARAGTMIDALILGFLRAPKGVEEEVLAMIRIALRMLLGDKLKYAGLVAGLAFATLLITQQGSIFAGFVLRTGAWIRDTGQADLWIMDEQVEFTEDRKTMLDNSLMRVRGVEGVEWAVPMYKAYMPCRLADGRRVVARVIGLDDATLLGAPPIMETGAIEALRQDRGIFIDAADAADELAVSVTLGSEERRPLVIGDRVDLNDHEMVVVGTYRRSTEFFWDPLIYTTYSRALAIAPPERRMLNFVLARVKPGYDHAAVAAQISKLTSLQAYTADAFEARSMDFILRKTGILANFGITIALGFVIGVLISGQLLYNFILDNQRSFAAMKAMGASNLMLLRMVGAQVMFAAFVGFGIGVGLTALSGQFLGKSELAFNMAWQVPVFGGFAILVCCLFAALLSISRVLRLEPAIVFKG